MSDTKKMKKKEKIIKKVRNVEADEETEELNIHKYEKINKKLKASSAEAPEFKKKKSIADKPVVTQQPVQVDVEKKKKKKKKNKELEVESKAKNNENSGSVKVTADMIDNFDKDDSNAALEKAIGEEEAEDNNDGEAQEKSSNCLNISRTKNKIAPESLKSILNFKKILD